MSTRRPQPLAEDDASGAGRTRPVILVADDDADLRGLIADALRDEGCDVTEAADGGRMLVRVAHEYDASDRPREAFDLIISDIYMPVCSGLEILEGLRRAHWRTPVILMTGRGDKTTRDKAHSLGAVLFTKPFDLDDLKTAIINLLPSRARHVVASEV